MALNYFNNTSALFVILNYYSKFIIAFYEKNNVNSMELMRTRQVTIAGVKLCQNRMALLKFC